MSTVNRAWWSHTRILMFVCLAIWLWIGLGVHLFVRTLNQFAIFDIPFGFYMAAQGSPLIFLVLALWYSMRQDAIDRIHDAAEDERAQA